MPRRDSARERQDWTRARRAEEQFARALREIARQCGGLAREVFDPEDPEGSVARLQRELLRYAERLRPWARVAAQKMVLDVQRRDEAFWRRYTQNMSAALRDELLRTPTGAVVRARIQESAALISSLPVEAADRVERFALRALSTSSRASELSQFVLRTGDVTRARANLIARTETSRSASILQQTRSEGAGSEGYIWRTAGDSDVRERHRKLSGRFFRWNAPPITGENGERSHPGCIYNCRCYAEVVFPEDAPARSRFRAEAA